MITERDMQAAERMLADLCAPMTDMARQHVADHFAAYREALLSDDRVDEVAEAMAASQNLGWGQRHPETGKMATPSYWMKSARAVLKTLRGEA